MRILSGLTSRLFAPLAAALVLMLTASGVSWAQTPSYVLQPGDQIEVSVWGEEGLLRNILIPPDGRFAFPLIGEVLAAGRTVGEIREEITASLSAYIPEAVVTVSVTGLEGNRIYVIGQVANPGTFVMNPRINVLQALSLAGGATPFASLNDILIVRNNGDGQELFPFRYNDVIRGRNLQQNINLESGDVVIVP